MSQPPSGKVRDGLGLVAPPTIWTMMTPRTLRRKLQKKKKHKPYRKCPKCGERMLVKFVSIDSHSGLLWPQTDDEQVLVKECAKRLFDGKPKGCGLVVQLFAK